MHPTLKKFLRVTHKVRLVILDFPLRFIERPQSGGSCQRRSRTGKFLITQAAFPRQILDPASLKKYATELGLDRTRFDAELDQRHLCGRGQMIC